MLFKMISGVCKEKIETQHHVSQISAYRGTDKLNSIDEVSTIDISDQSLENCEAMVASLEKYGVVIVRDSRVSFEDNAKFIDLMEGYFGLPDEVKAKDSRPKINFQEGYTEGGKEIPRCGQEPQCLDFIKEMPLSDRPKLRAGEPDPKERFLWNIGSTEDYPHVIPQGIEDWEPILNRWGSLLLNATETAAEMIATGLSLPKDVFTKKMKNAPHKLGPTGSNFANFTKQDTVLAGFHRDISFLTIHGKSRFPGLSVWVNHKKLAVKVPDGCLLIQSGLQLESLTGGKIKAGWHEVTIKEETMAVIEKKKKNGESLMRVSSTLFVQMASKSQIGPLPKFKSLPTAKDYPNITAGNFVVSELNLLDLKEK